MYLNFRKKSKNFKFGNMYLNFRKKFKSFKNL